MFFVNNVTLTIVRQLTFFKKTLFNHLTLNCQNVRMKKNHGYEGN